MFDLQGFFSPLSKIGISYKVKKHPINHIDLSGVFLDYYQKKEIKLINDTCCTDRRSAIVHARFNNTRAVITGMNDIAIS